MVLQKHFSELNMSDMAWIAEYDSFRRAEEGGVHALKKSESWANSTTATRSPSPSRSSSGGLNPITDDDALDDYSHRGRSTSSQSLGDRKLLTPRRLRSYDSVGNRELWQWLWLDFAAPVRSPISQLVRTNILRYSSSSSSTPGLTRNMGDVVKPEAIKEESVGLSRMVALVLGPMGEGSLRAGVFTLVSSAMGAGCLSLPFMIKCAGLVPGLFLLCLGAVLAHISLVVLMSCARYTGSRSMSRVAELAGGGHMAWIVDIVIAVYGIAAVLCYLIFIGDFFSGIVASPLLNFQVSRESLIMVISLLVVWPLSLPRNLSALRYVCVLSVFSICITAVFVACKAPGYISENREVAPADLWEVKLWSTDVHGLLQSFSIALFSFAAHTNAVPVAMSLSKADCRKIWRVSLYSVGIELVFYVLMGLGGYLSFRGLTRQDFILNYHNDDIVMLVVRCIYGVVVCLGAPINLSPAAGSIVGLISARNHCRASCKLHCLVATAIVAGAVCVAVLNEHVADVIGLIGASFGTLIVLAWPAMLYRKVLFDMHPKLLANSIYYLLSIAATLGFASFAVQCRSALQ